MIAHAVFRPRMLTNSELRRFSRLPHRRVLEIGSGKPVKGRFPYSAERFFPHAETFTRTDVVAAYGHRTLDLRSDSLEGYDTILCVSVLEHVDDWQSAVSSLTNTQPGTRILVIVPAFYPLHDEPNDYWRFTEHGLRFMFREFTNLELKPRGMVRVFPTMYAVTLVR